MTEGATPLFDARRIRLACFALALALTASGAASAWPHFADDAAISLRYADRLLCGQGLTWNDDERVEGYSNLAWVLLCAGLGGLGLDLVDAARILGAVATSLTLLLLASSSRGNGSALVLASSVPVAIWTLGGLEGPLVLFTWTAALLGLLRATADGSAPGPSRRAFALPGSLAALACLARPDGALLPLVATPWLVVRTRRLAPAFAFAAPVAIVVVGQLAFRLAYYGSSLPNTAAVKLHPGLSMLPAGLDYVGRGLTSSPALALLAASGAAVLLRRDRLAAALPIGLAVGWFGYLALVGGDFFVGGRLLLPGFAALAVLARAGLAAVPPKLVPLAVIAAVAVELGAAHLGDDVRRARGETWPLHGLSIGRSLRSAFAPDEDAATAVGTESVADPVHRRAVEASSHRTPRTDGARSTDATRAAGPLPRILVDAAGAVPFASRLPSIDMLGLCDRRTERDVAGIEHTPRSAFVAAHRRSTPDHLFALDPDLALFGSPPGIPIPADEAGIALLDDERFADRFHCVRWAADGAEGHEGRELVANLWVRVDGRAGVRREDGEVVVPARLFGSLTVPRGFRLEPPDEPAQRIAWQQEVERGIAWARDPVVARSRGAEFRAEGRYEFELKGLEHGTWSAVLVPGTTPLRVVAVEPSGDRDLREPRTLVGDVRLALVVPARERMPIHLVAVALRRHP